MEEVCPDAWFLNYTNPMAILQELCYEERELRQPGLCHSVQSCVHRDLLTPLGMDDEGVQWKIAGINHMGWLLEVTKDGKDLYPEIKAKKNTYIMQQCWILIPLPNCQLIKLRQCVMI